MIEFTIEGVTRFVSEDLWYSLEGPLPSAGFPTNGCTASPDYLRGHEVWPACVIHDFHYNSGSLSRKQADAIFRRNIIKTLRYSGMNRFSAFFYALIYWRAVRRLGGSFYNASGLRD